jgi:MSHA biogenesis protein MshJ
MKPRFDKLLRGIDALSLRERLFVLAAMMVVVGGIWEAALMQPLKSREAIASTKIDTAKGHLDQLNESISLAAKGIGEGMPAQQARLRALRERVADGDKELRIFTSDLVDPAQMRSVLEDLLRRQRGLKLISINNVESEPLIEQQEAADDVAEPSDDSGSEAPKLYRHGLILEVEGGYLDTLEYLKAVEGLPWHLFWTRLELESAYPRNTIVIELDTLSLDREYIGV